MGSPDWDVVTSGFRRKPGPGGLEEQVEQDLAGWEGGPARAEVGRCVRLLWPSHRGLRTGGFNTDVYFLWRLKSKVKVLAGSASPEASLLGL